MKKLGLAAPMWPYLKWLVPVLFVLAMLPACGGSSDSGKVLYIGGIPDQGAATLSRRFGTMDSYLSRELGMEVKYVPSVSYAALVTAFEKGDVDLVWFGGLTGVQARARAGGSVAIAQRPRDQEFHSVFIVRAHLDVQDLGDLKGLSFTFGSPSSTSGHLMPRHFLMQAGVDPERDFPRGAGFTRSHDKTWKLVQSGTFQAGALNEAVWQQRVSEGQVDRSRVRVFYTTPPYNDYNWTIRGGMDEEFGVGFTDRVQAAILALDPARPDHKAVLDLFQAERFIVAHNDDYEAIEDVARGLDIIR